MLADIKSERMHIGQNPFAGGIAIPPSPKKPMRDTTP